MAKRTNSGAVRAFVANVGSGWFALLVGGCVGFVTLPLSMNYLGEEQYGVVALVTSLVAVFQYLSFGLPPTILRFFSLAFANDDVEEARKIASTSQLIMGTLGAIGAVGFACCYPFFLSVYEIPKELHFGVWALFITTALNLLETFLLAPFFAVIQAKNRYDLGNYNRVVASLVRLATLWLGFRFFSPTLQTFAIAHFLDVTYRFVSIVGIAYWLEGRNIVFQKRYVSLDLLPKFFSFSALTLINTIFFPLSIQAPILIIGNTLGKEMVAAFSPSVVFSSFLSSILGAVATPLTPLASRDAVRAQGSSLGRWSLILSEIVAWFGGATLVVLCVMGEETLVLWMGETFVWTLPTFAIMTLGVVVAKIQAVNYNLALGASTIKPVAYSSIAMAFATAAGVWIGTAYCGWSILGVAICVAVIRVIRNTFYLSFAYSRFFGYDYGSYLWRVYCKPALYAICVAVVARWAKVNFFDFELSRVGMFAYLIVGSAIVASFYGALGWYFNVEPELKKRLPGIRKLPKWGRKLLRIPLD